MFWVPLTPSDGRKKENTKEDVRCNKDTKNSCHNSNTQQLERTVRSTNPVSASTSKPASSDESCSLMLIDLIKRVQLSMKMPLKLISLPPKNRSSAESGESQEVISMGGHSWRSFDYEELAVATNNFSSDNLIGKGGNSYVYKGCLPSGELVAVKKLTMKETGNKRTGAFLSELGIMTHINHPNVARLLGYSIKRGLHFVLQYSSRGSLASVLHGSKDGLNWKMRFKIALGVAEGLSYLHEGCERPIIHGDIKASNILLTSDYQPQISDFGIAKRLPENCDHQTVSPIAGTIGYLAPEAFMHGLVSEKTDVFAYGVLLLELITGRHAVDSSHKYLVNLVKPSLESNNLNELVDPSFRDDYDFEELKRAVSTASLCIHQLSAERPTMNLVVRLLKGKDVSNEVMEKMKKRSIVNPMPLTDTGDMEGYMTSSTYLDVLNKCKQLALED